MSADPTLRCPCGHEFVPSLGETAEARCLACHRPLDLERGTVADELMVSVDGRSMPLTVWEAEVLVRAASAIPQIIAGGVVATYLVDLAQTRHPLDSLGGFLVVFGFGIVIFMTGVGTAGRRGRARMCLLALCYIWLAAIGSGSVYVLYSSARGDDFVDQMMLPVFLVPEVFILYALHRRDGLAAFATNLRGVPLARLGSVKVVRRSVRAWAAYFMVCIATLSVAIPFIFGVVSIVTR